MRNHFLMSTVAVLGLSASPAMAQNAAADSDDISSRRLEEIVVTAQKREQNIQSVPLSILSVSGETLNRAGVTDPTALQKLPELRTDGLQRLFASSDPPTTA